MGIKIDRTDTYHEDKWSRMNIQVTKKDIFLKINFTHNVSDLYLSAGRLSMICFKEGFNC